MLAVRPSPGVGAAAWPRCIATALAGLAGISLPAGCADDAVDLPPPAVAPDAGFAADAGVEIDSGVGPAVTYFRDVFPIVKKNCMGCHDTGGIGPFDFTQPEVVQSAAVAIKSQVDARLMPPWHATEACNTYANDRSLNDAEIATIDEWVDLGAPLGDPASMVDPGDPPRLFTPTAQVQLTEPYAPQRVDDYRCFVLPWDETTEKYVTAYNVVPTNPGIVHHVNIYIGEPGTGAAAFRQRDAAAAGPGYPCFGGAFVTGSTLLGAWAPGSDGFAFPEGTGIRIAPGSVLLAEMHFFSPPGRDGVDQSTIELAVVDQVERRGLIAPFYNFFSWPQGGMSIPAGEAAIEHSFRFNPAQVISLVAPWLTATELEIHAAGVHMHYLGKTGRVQVHPNGADDACVLAVEAWDFDWQYGYLLEAPVPLNIGPDEVSVTCTFDNTQENQPVIDGEQRPAQDTNWGQGSTDEMCIGYMYVTERR